ncbi:MAG: hypothetical protein HRT66_08610 [Flavobacteriaceae bacterium]|nr:hypothetical protein [Flavobacteriaceae bacterium]
MKNIILTITFSLVAFVGFSQSDNEIMTNDRTWEIYQHSTIDSITLSGRIQDLSFIKLINEFHGMPLPFNDTKAYDYYNRSAPISGKLGRDFRIYEKETMKNFFKFSEEDFIKTELDRDAGEEVKQKFDIYATLSYIIDENYIALIYAKSSYTSMPYSTLESYLNIFDNKGNLIDSRVLIGDKLDLYNYESYVIIDGNHFAIYMYTPNESNIENKDLWEPRIVYLNEDLPKAQCVITYYEITEAGKILETHKSEPIYLKSDCWLYTRGRARLKKDDPILKY